MDFGLDSRFQDKICGESEQSRSDQTTNRWWCFDFRVEVDEETANFEATTGHVGRQTSLLLGEWFCEELRIVLGRVFCWLIWWVEYCLFDCFGWWFLVINITTKHIRKREKRKKQRKKQRKKEKRYPGCNHG